MVPGTNALFVFGSDTIRRPFDNLLFYRAFTSYGKIQGRLYMDRNSDCAFDMGPDTTFDIGVVRARKISDTLYKNALADGMYTMFLPDTGNHNIALFLPKYYKTSCPPSGSYNIGFLRDTVMSDLDFGITVDNYTRDIAVKLVPTTGFRTRLGYISHYYLTVSNPGTLPLSSEAIKLKIKIDPDTNFGSNRMFTKTGNEITWNTLPLNPHAA